mmetsp:Transcript_35343/g.65815  ORF Transcript_35343/g.65815 Transcript_35343/m.65815 type:complete len:190 (-) Transcript_35343:142-711(-)
MCRSEPAHLAINQIGFRMGEIRSTVQPTAESTASDLGSLPAPSKPDLDLISSCAMPQCPAEADDPEEFYVLMADDPEDAEEAYPETNRTPSWVEGLRTMSTTSFHSPGHSGVPPGVKLAPDGRAHWRHVGRMDEFFKDVAECPPKFRYMIRRRRQRDLKPTDGSVITRSCTAVVTCLMYQRAVLSEFVH